ncbi:MAG: hypothetical protein ABI939_00305 [Anaerolineaceae bacterium]
MSVLRTFAETPSTVEPIPLELTLADTPAATAPGSEPVSAGPEAFRTSGSPQPVPEASSHSPVFTPEAAAVAPPAGDAMTVAETPGAPKAAPATTDPAGPAEPELTLHQGLVAPQTSTSAIRRRFDPLRFVRRNPAPESEVSTADESAVSAQTNLAAASRLGEAPAPTAGTESPATVSPTLVARSVGTPSDAPEMTLLATALESPDNPANESDSTMSSPSPVPTHSSLESLTAASVEMPLSPAMAGSQSPATVAGEPSSSFSGAPGVARSADPPHTAATAGEPTALPEPGRPAFAAAGSQINLSAADLTLQRSPVALPESASVDPVNQRNGDVASPPLQATQTVAADQTPALPLQRSGGAGIGDSHITASSDGPRPPSVNPLTSPQGDGPAAAIARSEAAPAEYANLDLVAAPTLIDARTPDSASLAPSAPTERLNRSVDSSTLPPSATAPAPAAPSQSGPTPVTKPLSLDLAVSPTAFETPPGDTFDATLQRVPAPTTAALTPTQSDGETEPSALTAKVNSGGNTLAGDPLRLDLASPAPAPGTAGSSGPATHRPEGPPHTGSAISRGGQQTSSPAAAIARTFATSTASNSLADLPLSAPSSLVRPAEGGVPEPGAIARATAYVPPVSNTGEGASSFDLAARDAGHRTNELSRTIAQTQFPATATGSDAPLYQPLVTLPPSYAAEFEPSPGASQLHAAQPGAQAARSLQRSPDMPLSIEPPADGAQRTSTVEAFGAITSIQRADYESSENSSNSGPISEANLEQITEHVWQFVRKELRVERERQRGQA